MNKAQESFRTMLTAVYDFMQEFITIWTASAGTTAAVTQLNTYLTNIDTYSQGQQTDTKGVTITKGTKRTTLVTKIMKVANALYAFGNTTGNTTLAGQAKLNQSLVARLPDTILGDLAQTIRTLGNTNIASLAGYNVVAADITALQTARTSFVSDIPKPKVVIGNKKASTSQLKNSIKLAKKHLEEVLDPAVRTYNETEPEFVSGYFNVRTIYDTGYQKLAAKFIVDDSVTHLGLANVQILITPGDVQKKTSSKGISLIKSLAGGTYSVTLSKEGYTSQTFTIYITDGETRIVVKSMVALP